MGGGGSQSVSTEKLVQSQWSRSPVSRTNRDQFINSLCNMDSKSIVKIIADTVISGWLITGNVHNNSSVKAELRTKFLLILYEMITENGMPGRDLQLGACR